jgi:hypothetical protein
MISFVPIPLNKEGRLTPELGPLLGAPFIKYLSLLRALGRPMVVQRVYFNPNSANQNEVRHKVLWNRPGRAHST